MQNQTAGDPQSARKWKRQSLHQLSEQLKSEHQACPHTVGRVLREQEYSLHVDYKELDGRASPHRNQQFDLRHSSANSDIFGARLADHQRGYQETQTSSRFGTLGASGVRNRRESTATIFAHWRKAS
jgi:hypothetical protein